MTMFLWKLKSRIDTFLKSFFLFKNILPRYISNLPDDIFFIEIGANDGIEFDPLYKSVIAKKWSGVYIEPQKLVYEKLVANFKGIPNLFFENIAITENEMEIPIYSPDSKVVDENSLIASMSSEKGVLRHFSKNQIKKEIVQGKPFKYIIDKYQLKSRQKILLLIDVEGFEKEIIFGLNLNDFKPKYLIFEHAHLTYDIHREINSFLVKFGYKIYLDEFDTLATIK
jgi:FkbM family methyltransferase